MLWRVRQIWSRIWRRTPKYGRPIDAALVIAMRRDGMSCLEIGRRLGHHSSNISRVLIRYGMRTRHNRKGDA